MPNKLQTKIISKSWLVGLVLAVQSLLSASMAAELETLFSTPQERELINANRYDSVKVNPQPEKAVNPEPIKQLVKTEVIKTFRINGITLANEGPHSVWINDKMYLDGELVEDSKSRIKVIAGKDIKVRITAPDGKQYFGTSGESLEVKYLEATDS
jgi:hypothetical protein